MFVPKLTRVETFSSMFFGNSTEPSEHSAQIWQRADFPSANVSSPSARTRPTFLLIAFLFYDYSHPHRVPKRSLFFLACAKYSSRQHVHIATHPGSRGRLLDSVLHPLTPYLPWFIHYRYSQTLLRLQWIPHHPSSRNSAAGRPVHDTERARCRSTDLQELPRLALSHCNERARWGSRRSLGIPRAARSGRRASEERTGQTQEAAASQCH